MLGFHIKGLLVAILAGAVAGLITRWSSGHVQAGWVAGTVVVVFVLVIGIGVVRRLATTFTVTSRRLLIERGVLSRELQETRLERVQNVVAHQTVRERLLRVGALHFDTAAGADFDFSFHGVANPRGLVRTVDRALREREQAGLGM